MAAALKVLERTRPLWHDGTATRMLGCTLCHNEPDCGGLNIAAPAFSCHDFCTCNDKAACNFVCPSRTSSYVRYLKEIGGSFDLDPVPRGATVPVVKLPNALPMIYGRASRTERLRASWACVPLARLFSRRTGEAKFRTREELAQAFLIDPDAHLIISGVDVDLSLERYWRLGRSGNLLEVLASLKPDLVTTPNFSLFVNAPREDNLHNMKRIAICWHELNAAGIPTALHVNARTDRDWKRWARFISDRPEITAIAFEFATGPKYPERGTWHVDHLCRLREDVGRDLQLVIRGARYAGVLRRCYHQVTLIDTSLYVKTMRRQKLVSEGHIQRWERTFTLTDEPLDQVMQRNLDAGIQV